MPPNPAPHLYEAPPAGALAIGMSPLAPADEVFALRNEETRLLACAVGEHLPAEIASRVEAIRLRVAALHEQAR